MLFLARCAKSFTDFVNPRRFFSTIKRLYRVKNIKFVYLDLDIDKSLERMISRGDNLNECYHLRKKRYKKAIKFHKKLLQESKINNKRINNYNLILDTRYSIKTNMIKVKNWMQQIIL